MNDQKVLEESEKELVRQAIANIDLYFDLNPEVKKITIVEFIKRRKSEKENET